MAWLGPDGENADGAGCARGMLAAFRGELYRCFTRRADALFEVADAMLCKQDRVHMLAELSLEPECRRGHGGVFDAVSAGRVQIGRLRRALAGLPLDAVRLGPADDATEVTAAQVRDVVERIIAAGHWHDGDPDILAVFDSGYDLTRLAWLLAGLPVEVMGRLRSDRVMYFPAPPRPARPAGTGGRPPRPGAGCTSSWPAAAAGKTTTARCRSSRAPSSGLPSITCPATAAPNRYGCG